MSLDSDYNTEARDCLLGHVSLWVAVAMFVLLAFTGHPLAAAAGCLAALSCLFFFGDAVRVGHRISRREEL